ncbi:hypothetical protein FACS1894176_08630 [Bacteroidia bacterium]|nr:hypothetical protein FACS1894176_08630 [Bacteroidia bacterium]
MIYKDLILEMYNRMDDSFKKQNALAIKGMLETYPCLCFSKDDLTGYLENEYSKNYADDRRKERIKKVIEDYDESDLEYVARKLVTDCMMESYWIAIDCWLDKIGYGLPCEDDDFEE